jgi:hypothetical protein
VVQLAQDVAGAAVAGEFLQTADTASGAGEDADAGVVADRVGDRSATIGDDDPLEIDRGELVAEAPVRVGEVAGIVGRSIDRDSHRSHPDAVFAEGAVHVEDELRA